MTTVLWAGLVAVGMAVLAKIVETLIVAVGRVERY